jgi:hypothetical protein
MLDQPEPPAINRNMLLLMDPYNQEHLSLFKKTASAEGLSEEFSEGVFLELRKKAEREKEDQKNLLKEIRKDMLKEAKEMQDRGHYTDEYIHHITKDPETFEKLAMLECQSIWKGFEAEMLKMGKDQSFVDGMVKEASWASFIDLARAGKTLGKYPLQAIKSVPKLLGRVEASNKALSNAAGNASHLLDSAGNVVTNAMPRRISGAGLGEFITEFKQNVAKNVPGGLSAADQATLKNVQQRAANRVSSEIAKGSENAFQKHMYDLHQQAQHADPAISAAARANINQIARGDFSSVEKGMNLKPGTAAQMNVGAANSGVMRDAMMHAREASKAGFDPTKFDPYVNRMNDAARNIPAGAPMGTQAVEEPGTFRLFNPTWGKGLGRAATGAMLGSVGGVPGALVGGALGGLSGTFGTGTAAAALGAGGLYGGKKLLDATGLTGTSTERDPMTGAQTDRNRVVPFMNNQFAGGMGGWLLGSVIAQRMGLQGLPAWILPLLGAIAGKNMLPQMMNRMRDPYGYGANRINPAAALVNQQYGG